MTEPHSTDAAHAPQTQAAPRSTRPAGWPGRRLTWRPSLRQAALGLAAVACLGAAQALVAPWQPRPKQRPAAAPAAATPPVPFGQPLAGLDAAQLLQFQTGRAEFEAQETPEGGLGPVFNDRACAACHGAGGLGGGSDRTVTRFGRVVNGVFDPLAERGGPLLQARAIAPEALERVPAQATVRAQRLTTPVFGAGLVEAIADADIVANAQRQQGTAVQGRVAWVTDPASGARRAGRFGWKAQHATLASFSADAYLNEMGITNRLFPTENAPNGDAALLARFDHVPDVEDATNPATGKADFELAADFMRLLAPPQPLRATAATLAGQRVFERVGCASCHTPVLHTAAHAVPALSQQAVALYSDLLLHDMGALGDGIPQGAAAAREMRTAPLWGLRARRTLMHDGRATSPAAAVLAHDGQGRAARDAYQRLTAAERQQLLDFLASL